MGWFDGSSDEEDDAPKKNKSTLNELPTFVPLSLSVAPPREEPKDEAPQDGDNGGEEVDPLDAYMNALTGANGDHHPKEEEQYGLDSSTQETATKILSEEGERLDWDNEDEATSHWSKKRKKKATASIPYQQDEEEFAYDGATPQSAEPRKATQARQALDAGFVRAGGNRNNKTDKPLESDLTVARSQSGAAHAKDPPREPLEKVFWQDVSPDPVQAEAWRKTHEVTITWGGSHKKRNQYQDKRGLGANSGSKQQQQQQEQHTSLDPIYHLDQLRDCFGSDLAAAITKAGYSTPTAVQAQVLPLALAGKDVLVTAATGQGKTLAYLWPMMVHLTHQPRLTADETGPCGLVLVPTRELAIQVHHVARPLVQAIQRRSRVVIGGQGKYLLVQELKKHGGVDLVVATPGRLLDVLSSGTSTTSRKGLSLKRCSIVAVDEVDKMVAMGFATSVTEIVGNIRPDRQTLLLSATLTNRMDALACKFLDPANACRIAVGRTGESSEHVLQHVVVLPHFEAKKAFLLEMLPTLAAVGRTLVFVATRESCETLATLVRQYSTSQAFASTGSDADETMLVETLHGDKHQSDRNAALKAFRSGRVKILIATDVAARGLDVQGGIATVLNFDAAKNLDAHVHRVGRAGRLDKSSQDQQTGSAYTLLTRKDADFAQSLRQAWEREGREVSSALTELAQQSRQSHAGRPSWNKTGLGAPSLSTRPDAPPPAKRSRWQ